MANKKERKEKKIPQFNIKKCNSCVICIDSCPVDCLSMSVASSGIPNHKYPNLLNQAICTGCGSCAEDCPTDAVMMVNP